MNCLGVIFYHSDCCKSVQAGLKCGVFLLRGVLISCEPQVKAVWQCNRFGWNSSFTEADCQILVVDVVRGSPDLLLLTACLRVDLLLNIYVILKLVGGWGVGGVDVMAWLTTGILRHTLETCLDSPRTVNGVFVFCGQLLNDLLSLHTYRLWQSKLAVSNIPFDHHDSIRLGNFSMHAPTCVTHVWGFCDCSCKKAEGKNH